jgi:pimeloyl-ACP methyl ester carboxylesterase
VLALGESLGGAIALQALATDANLCGVVAEGAYSSFREIAYERIYHGLGHTLLRPLVEIGLAVARSDTGIDLDEANPTAAIAASSSPVLLFHGDRDTDNSPEHSRRLQRAQPKADFWLVPGAAHSGAHGVAPLEFERRVLAFFARSSSARTSCCP